MRLAPFLLLCACGAAQEPAEILGRIRHNVAAQISRSANYSCVETVERDYFFLPPAAGGACSGAPAGASKPYLRDRLRLDVAVSSQSEIYSWHGENNFTSTSVAEVVRGGPISSGGFVGYLMNIFLEPNISISYVGESNHSYNFQYDVSLANSKYQTLTCKGYARIPFHGTFSAEAGSFQLKDLVVTGSDFPPVSDICFAESQVRYQIARISGGDSLIPSGFLLKIGNRAPSLFTESRGAYSECREFKGESTLVFDTSGQPSKTADLQPAAKQKMGAGKILRIKLTTPIDDRTSFTGDRVEGVVEGPWKDATVRGVITELATRYDPAVHYYLKIEFEQMTADGQVYSLRALHKPTGKEASKLYFLFGENLPEDVSQEIRQGTMILYAKHLRLNRGFTGDWVTVGPR
ncbi:MAG TPA: hypothetical protein VK493_12860 [Bryobacteraceae bacterium]|nr:hypothetical protein [Bryobacteraceae bacterium]